MASTNNDDNTDFPSINRSQKKAAPPEKPNKKETRIVKETNGPSDEADGLYFLEWECKSGSNSASFVFSSKINNFPLC